jgi:hypothetical protein
MINPILLSKAETILKKENLRVIAADKSLKTKDGEFNEAMSLKAKEFFKELLKDNPQIDSDEYRSYMNTDTVDLFVAHGRCWVAVKENNKLKFMTHYTIESLKKG